MLAGIDAAERGAEQRPDRHYRVHRGDTLSKVAHRFGVSEAELAALNGLRSRHAIQVGQLLRLPLREEPAGAPLASQAPPADGRYTVRRGDSLQRIARRFGTSEAELARLNELRDRHTIQVGQVLRLPGAAGAPADPAPEAAQAAAVSYRVQSGDNLSRIAERHGVTLREIARLNGLRDRDALRVGQTLRLPAGAQAAPPPPPAPAAPAPPVELASAKEAATPEPPSAATPAPPAPAPAATVTATGAPPAPPTPASATPPPASPAPGPSGPAAGTAPEPGAALAAAPEVPEAFALDPLRFRVDAEGWIRVQPEETLGHYAEWLEVPTQRLRHRNHIRSDQAITLGRRVALDLSRVSAQEFERRRLDFHRELVDGFFREHRMAGTRDYVLESGDTLWVLSQRKLAIPVWLLSALNPDVDFAAPLRVGQRLRVPQVEPRRDA